METATLISISIIATFFLVFNQIDKNQKSLAKQRESGIEHFSALIPHSFIL